MPANQNAQLCQTSTYIIPENMHKRYIYPVLTLLIFTFSLYSQKKPSDANLVGHVVGEGAHLPFASVAVTGTTLGTVTDETGHFQLVNLPAGERTVVVSVVGYKTKTQVVHIQPNTTLEVKFELEVDRLNLEEVVVSANRSEQKRTEAPVIVNTISSEIFRSTQSVTLGEGLSFLPGLRLENNCQNCGFTQVRMNGMEGPYSQILINSRPIFSGLAGVYGLELIPSNMIEKVEVVRGGGSALYGSNAIAGTINIILKDPTADMYEAGVSCAMTGVGTRGSGGAAPDYSVNFNGSLVSDDLKSGLSVYGFTRKRELYDANNDSFSEIAPLNNITFGGRAFHRFSYRDKLAVDFFAIHEERNGGNMQDRPLHERDIAEALTHDMQVASLIYERYFRDYDMLSLFGSAQFLTRDSYYGAAQSLSGYGKSVNRSYNLGAQYKAVFGNASLVTGIENTGDFLVDQKLGYPDYDHAVIARDSILDVPHVPNTLVADQSSITTGVFAQYDIQIYRLKVSAGARFDHYAIEDRAQEGEAPKTGDVFSPRLSLMYEILPSLQIRASYSQGYRAPQIFDEDLHIETSASRQVIHQNHPDLRQETSHSYMASLDFNRRVGKVFLGFLAEGFHTRLVDAFANEYDEPNEDGTVIYTRVNSEGGATVQGVNMELKLQPRASLALTSGFTAQTSKYSEPQDFKATRFFRTPNTYGYLAADWDFAPGFCLKATGNYTGEMLVPYFGTDHPEGELRTSHPFFDLGIKLAYTVKLNGASLEFAGGVKNLFNSYQEDFDYGINRDPAYVYGPMAPRTLYFSLRFGNLLN